MLPMRVTVNEDQCAMHFSYIPPWLAGRDGDFFLPGIPGRFVERSYAFTVSRQIEVYALESTV